MARIIRRRVFLGGKARKRKLRGLLFAGSASVPAPAAGTPNKDFFTVTKRKRPKKKKRPLRRAHQKQQDLLLRLLFLQSHPSSVLVPEVEKTLLPSAEATLTNAGLGWHITFVPSLTPFDVVIQQTPIAGTPVAIGTVVDLLVSSGSVILPNELNKAIDIAVAELLALGLFPQVTQKPTTKVLPGLVTKQVPGPGQRLLVGQPVFLEVSVQPPPGAADNLLPSLSDIVNVVTVVQ